MGVEFLGLVLSFTKRLDIVCLPIALKLGSFRMFQEVESKFLQALNEEGQSAG